MAKKKTKAGNRLGKSSIKILGEQKPKARNKVGRRPSGKILATTKALPVATQNIGTVVAGLQAQHSRSAQHIVSCLNSAVSSFEQAGIGIRKLLSMETVLNMACERLDALTLRVFAIEQQSKGRIKAKTKRRHKAAA